MSCQSREELPRWRRQNSGPESRKAVLPGVSTPPPRLVRSGHHRASRWTSLRLARLVGQPVKDGRSATGLAPWAGAVLPGVAGADVVEPGAVGGGTDMLVLMPVVVEVVSGGSSTGSRSAETQPTGASTGLQRATVPPGISTK